MTSVVKLTSALAQVWSSTPPGLNVNLIQINIAFEDRNRINRLISEFERGRMANNNWVATVTVLCFCLLTSACGTNPIRGDIPSGFQSGTHILGEVAKRYTRDEVIQDKLPRFTSALKDDLIVAGIAESDIVDGSEVGVVTYCYAHNSSVSPCTHIGYYMAHASPELRDQVKLGSIVEVSMRINRENRLMGSIVRVYGHGNDPALGCSAQKLNYKGFATLSPLGPPVAGWLYCEGIPLLQEGWVKKSVPGAPCGPFVSGPCAFEFQKPPSDR